MIKKICLNIMVLLSISLLTGSLQAKQVDNFEFELDAIQKKLESNQSKLSGLERQINSILVEVVRLDKEIEKVNSKYEDINEKLKATQEEIKTYDQEMQNVDKKEVKVNIQLESRLRKIYEEGSIKKIDLFFNSKSLFDYLKKYTIIMDILEIDKKNYTGKVNEKQEKDKTKKKIVQQKDKKTKELESLQEILKEEKEALEVKKAAREKYVAQLKNNQEMLTAQNQMLVKQEEELSNSLTSEIQKLIDEQRRKNNIVASTPNAQGFVWPFPAGGVVTAGFPNYPASFGGGRHDGFDIALAGATQKELVAAKAGIVVKAVSNRPQNTYPYAMTYGNHVIIMHDDGVTTTLYGHMEAVDVVVGQRVETGQVIGLLGNSGYSTGPHLHFEVRVSGVPKNPTDYVNK